MAPNGDSEIHDDAWQTDAYSWSGPLGRSPATFSTLLRRDAARSRSIGAGGWSRSASASTVRELYMFDPATLATLATFALPPRQGAPANLFQDFSGGGYFYLDDRDRVVTAHDHPTHLRDRRARRRPGFTARATTTSAAAAPGEKLTSALPDSRGLLWFVARRDGVVGTRQPPHRRGSGDAARPRRPRRDRELVRDRRRRRRLHRHRPPAVPLRRGPGRPPADRLAGRLSQQPASTSPARSTPAPARRRR